MLSDDYSTFKNSIFDSQAIRYRQYREIFNFLIEAFDFHK